MKRLAVLDAQSAPCRFLETFQSMCVDAGVEPVALECRSAEEIAAGADGCAAAICFFVNVGKEALRHLSGLEMVVRAGIGVDNFVLDDFTEHGVLACNTPDYGIEEVAVHALALLLALERNLVNFGRSTRQGDWDQTHGRELHRVSHKTLGLIGFGRTARKLCELASPLGYRILVYDPHVTAEVCRKLSVRKVGLDELFFRADAISVMAPATPETEHIVNADRLALSRDGLLLVNTSRGSLVSTEAVMEALDSGKLHGVALDVLEEEPPAAACRKLLAHDAVIATPHIAYRSVESIQALIRMSVQTALDYLCLGKVNNLINTAVLRTHGINTESHGQGVMA